jgi:hypothetical protein
MSEFAWLLAVEKSNASTYFSCDRGIYLVLVCVWSLLMLRICRIDTTQNSQLAFHRVTNDQMNEMPTLGRI